MTVRVRFFATFQTLFGARDRALELEDGATAGRLLDLLGDTPARRDEIFAGSGELRPHLVVLVGGTPLASRGGLAAELRDGDIVSVFPMMGGG